MTKARITFDQSIKDAEELLAIYDSRPKTNPEDGEVLKRAGLVMALTAWETYVEDVVQEKVASRLRIINGSQVAKFVQGKLTEELKRFHNPTAEKTRKLFVDYLDVDITLHWVWSQFEPPRVKKILDDLIAKRGDAVHRSKPVAEGQPPSAHLVRKEELDKAIKFLKALVGVTDDAILRASDGQA